MTYGPKRPMLAIISFPVSGLEPRTLGKLKSLSASWRVTVEGSFSFGILERRGLGLSFVFSPSWTYGPKRPSRIKIGKPVFSSVPIGLIGSTIEPSMRRAPVQSGYFSQLINLPPRPSLIIMEPLHTGHFHSLGAGPRLVNLSIFSFDFTSLWTGV